MSNLSQRFNNLSLYKKILLILSTTLLFVFFAFVVGIQLLSQYYARELYTSNAQSLNYVSSFVSAVVCKIYLDRGSYRSAAGEFTYKCIPTKRNKMKK